MRFIVKMLLLVAGLAAFSLTYYFIFPNNDGLLDISRLEGAFLFLYTTAIIRLHARNRQLGYGIWKTVEKVMTSAGACCLTYFVVFVTLLVLVANEGSLSASGTTDDLSTVQLTLVIWLGSLLVFLYLAAPKVQLLGAVTDSTQGDLAMETTEQKSAETRQ